MDRLKESTTKLRLIAYRDRRDEYARSTDPKKFLLAQAHTWTYWRRPLHPTSPNNTRGKEGQIFADDKEQYGNWLGSAGDLKACDHNGWYADNFQGALVIGGVVRIYSSKGTYYVPVTYRDDCDCSTVYWMGDAELVAKLENRHDDERGEHEDAIKRAARTADHYAEREAEEAREEDAKYQAESQIEAAREEIHEINKRVLPLIRDTRAKDNGFTPAICAALKERVSEYLEERSEAFKRIARLSKNYWLAVE